MEAKFSSETSGLSKLHGIATQKDVLFIGINFNMDTTRLLEAAVILKSPLWRAHVYKMHCVH
jgi:hypothetical protein